MKTIVTKYLGPTETQGARVKASVHPRPRAKGQTVTMPRDYAVDASEQHRLACAELLAKVGWSGEMVGGTLDPDTLVWVFVDRSDRAGTAIAK